MKLQSLSISLLTGMLFGLGLSLSQMIDPAKVVNFMDVFGTWDPSLAFVMLGGLVVNIIAFKISSKRALPLIQGEIFHTPTKTKLDGKLLTGAALFGIGWGMAGYCPGPMIASISFGGLSIWLMLSSFIVGTLATKIVLKQVENQRIVSEKEACVG